MAEPRTIVYVGPSLPHHEVRRCLPAAEIHPPVRHGDLAGLSARPGDTVLLIDGIFLHSAAVRHKEILALLAAGVTVAGSSSMGALRAAELAPYGMRGVGQIFDLYRRGVIDGDDEVAITHAAEEDGLRALSEPMVNIRLDVGRAHAAGVLDLDQHDRLLAAVKAQPFRERCLPRLHQIAATVLGRPAAAGFAAWLRTHHVDTKAQDARALLALAAAGADALGPPGAADEPITNLDTVYAVGWSHLFASREVDGVPVTRSRVADAVAIVDPGFARRYRAAVLGLLAAAEGEAPRSTQEAERVCVATARRRGLLGAGDTLAESCWAWLTPTERSLPGRDAILRVLARNYGTRAPVRLSVLPGLMPPDSTQWYRWVAAVTALADVALRRRPAPGAAPYPARPPALRLKPAAVDAFCAATWRCPTGDLTAAAWDRGFADLDQLRLSAGDLAVHARWFGRAPHQEVPCARP